jgi:hypothetical protein
MLLFCADAPYAVGSLDETPSPYLTMISIEIQGTIEPPPGQSSGPELADAKGACTSQPLAFLCSP